MALLQQRLQQSGQGRTITGLMQSLVNVYVPACFAIGWQVRTCSWTGRERGSGRKAKECLMSCFLLLLGLLGDRAKVSEYVRSLAVALMSWTDWHDSVPAAAYVEEACEAQLSRLSSALKRNPHATGVADVSDIYILLGVPDQALHAAHHHPVSSDLQRAVNDNLLRFTSAGPAVVAHVPWKSSKTCTVTQQWPDVCHIPRPPWTVPQTSIDTCLLHALRRVHQGTAFNSDVTCLLNDFVSRTSNSQRSRHRQAVESLMSATEHTIATGVTRALNAQMTVRDRTDPPPKRRRVTAAHAAAPRNAPDVADGSQMDVMGPRFVGIPLE